jgi:hypothetical protein
MRAVLAGVLIAGGMIWGLWQFVYSGGFTDADMASVKKDIAEEFAKKPGITVSSVILTRDNSRKLSGIVELQSTVLGKIVKTCQAAYGEKGSDGYWVCD